MNINDLYVQMLRSSLIMRINIIVDFWLVILGKREDIRICYKTLLSLRVTSKNDPYMHKQRGGEEEEAVAKEYKLFDTYTNECITNVVYILYEPLCISMKNSLAWIKRKLETLSDAAPIGRPIGCLKFLRTDSPLISVFKQNQLLQLFHCITRNVNIKFRFPSGTLNRRNSTKLYKNSQVIL